MRASLFIASCVAMIFVSACGCVTGNGADAKAEVLKPEPPKARVKPLWQDYLVKELSEAGGDATEAFGLFSEGGWADAGQIMVVTFKAKAPRLMVVQAGHKSVSIDRTLTDAEWKALAPALTGSKSLKDTEVTAFDALNFELAHATKDRQGAMIDRRAFYCSAGGHEDPEFEKVIKALSDLRKAP